MPRHSDATSLSAAVYYYTSTLTYAFFAASASILLLALMLYPTAVLRWLQRKRYQYEVTFSLYMLTPTEKFIFNSFVFLFASMIVIAASLYLPEHISFLVNRAAYYLAGETSGAFPEPTNAQHLVETSVAAAKATVTAAAHQAQERIVGNGAGVMEL
ncbi:hypothetical protein UCRNP2_2209 [Neofusicoccum parvum UCRNP2]|uniref:Uncharacterized protein n=1 Tax=Botryosphaeria parva (strain UCR-NP2) TaxID=1287680 RepID=R1GY80_BOTPV|nr:hypothetical protein UCRNP2_2209 [Neofusicoccum parvum UCRNP2]